MRPLPASLPAQQAPGLVVDDAALADEPSGAHWLGFGRTYDEQRFSPLARIDTATVRDLAVDWYIDLPGERGLVSTPLVVDGVLYFIGSLNVVRAVDATSGALLWEYDPEVATHAGRRMRSGWDHSRGIAYWQGMVYVATWDGRLNAVDAATGRELWSTMTIAPEDNFYITGAPQGVQGQGARGQRRHGARRGPRLRDGLRRRDRRAGVAVPHRAGAIRRRGSKTTRWPWRPRPGPERGGGSAAGGNAWHGFTYDPEFDALYIGTGNGSPWNRKIRSPGGGDNLFLCSIVALDPDTGEYRWHYQTTPGETWDYNSNMDIVLADLTLEGPHGEGAAARTQERLLLRDRPRGREPDLRCAVHADHVGHGDRPGQRAPRGGAGRALRRRTGGRLPGSDRRPQLARDVVQPGHRPGVLSRHSPVVPLLRREHRTGGVAFPRARIEHGRPA